MRKTGLLLSVILLVLVTGCRDYLMKSDRMVVAECYGHKLYADDLDGVVPVGASQMDSLTRVNAFIDSWIRTQLLIHQAEINLPPEQLDFSQQLQDYRNSLTIYAYESQMIEQYLDTVVSEEEIAAYYEGHKENFQLRATMVKVAYVVLDENCKHVKEFKKVMSRRDTLMMSELDELVEQYAISSFLDVDVWVRLDDLLNMVPMEIYNAESFLRRNQFVSFEKDNLLYLVRFEDYLMEKNVSPIEIVGGKIKSIILLQREKELIQRMNAELYERAKKENVFEIY
jgi:hypothetical protein